MIEITFMEGVLFAWGVIATAYALKYKEEEQRARSVLMAVIERKDVRDNLVEEYAKFMKEIT